jgi:hypothetical protein
MTMRYFPTEITRHLQEHERTVLAHLLDVLSQSGEEGYLIPGHFEAAERQLQGKEIDGILILPDLVLLLELKSRYAERIDLWDLKGPMRVWRDGSPAAEANPLTGLWYVSTVIRTRVKEANPDSKVYPVLIADAYGRPLDLRVGQLERPWGVAEGAAACKPENVAELVQEIRNSLGFSSPYPLRQDKRLQLEQLAKAVYGNIRPVPQATRRVGDFILEHGPAFEEPEFIVFEGKEMDTLQPVWVKEYRRDMLATGKWAKLDRVLVLRDAVALANLGDHPNLARYKTKIDMGDRLYVVLKREPGWFLRGRMESGQLTLEEKLHILSDLLVGLAHVHSHKEGNRTALYRDLRPESVFITEDGRAQLFNFDCTRLPSRSTAFEQARGRAQRWRAYASYELLNAEVPEQVNTPTDIYSWGVVAYELLTGQLPYTDEAKAAHGSFTSLAQYQLSIPQPLQILIEQALSPISGKRPSLGQLRAAIQEAIDGLR